MTAPQPHETPEAGTVTDGPDRHYRSQLTCIGGGTGLAAALAAARLIDPEPTALVSVVDDGGSSGRLVAERGGLPPGDLRKCLAALAPVDSPWRRLLDHRFVGGGSLGGHALGNLILAALEDQEGDLASAAARLAGIMGCRGRVVPVSLQPHVLVAETRSGVVRGQEAVNYSSNIRRIHLDPPDPKAHPDAVEAITRSSAVVIGPGSLFTSVIPPVLVPDVAAALASTSARRVFVANLAPQVAETRHLDLAGHVNAFLDHGGRADVVLFDPEAALGGAAGSPLPMVAAPMLDPARPACHNPDRLAAALGGVLGGVRST